MARANAAALSAPLANGGVSPPSVAILSKEVFEFTMVLCKNDGPAASRIAVATEPPLRSSQVATVAFRSDKRSPITDSIVSSSTAKILSVRSLRI